MTANFFFNDTATTEIYAVSLRDALPIRTRSPDDRARELVPHRADGRRPGPVQQGGRVTAPQTQPSQDRKSTRLNSSHANISYAVFCLKKKYRSVLHDSDLLQHL